MAETASGSDLVKAGKKMVPPADICLSRQLWLYAAIPRTASNKLGPMFERYTETARNVVVSSKYKAAYLGSLEIDLQHLLLGLLATDKGFSRRFLPLGPLIRFGERSSKVEQSVNQLKALVISLRSLSKRAPCYAAEEAERISCMHISTEHPLAWANSGGELLCG